MTLVSLLIAGLFALCLLAIGPWLQDLYTLGETAFTAPVALVLVGAATLRTLSAAPMAILAADNAHAPVITRYLLGSIVALASGVLLALGGAQLHLVLLPLLFAEACQLFPSMRRALAAVGMRPGAFVSSLVSGERLEDAKALLGRLLARS